MSKIDLPYEITNLQPANAVPVQSNFARIEQHTNNELIERGGTVAMTAQLRLVGNPVNALDAAPKQYVDTIVPIGGVIMYTGVAAPVGGIWLVCDGSPVEAAVYPALFAVMGTRFGGSGGFFNLPPLSERFPVGAGANIAVGAQGGSKDAVVVNHNHDISHTHPGSNTGTVSSDHSHAVNIMSGAADRPLGTSSDGFHNHTVPLEQSQGFLVSGLGATPADLQQGGTAYGFLPFVSGNGAHTHTVTDHLHPVNGNTGGISANHSHAFNTPTFNGASAATGQAAANANMPPYVGIIFIVRAA